MKFTQFLQFHSKTQRTTIIKPNVMVVRSSSRECNSKIANSQCTEQQKQKMPSGQTNSTTSQTAKPTSKQQVPNSGLKQTAHSAVSPARQGQLVPLPVLLVTLKKPLTAV